MKPSTLVFSGPIFLLLSFITCVETVGAQREERDAKAISKVKNIAVSRLDKKLSSLSFSRWFSRTLRNKQPALWELNDCGEQDGSGRQKDFPICVQAYAKTSDQIAVTVMIAVGTHKRGIFGKPVTWGIWVGSDQVSSIVLDRLNDLPKALVKHRKSK